MTISAADIDEIKRSSDIVGYIGARIKLKKNGKDFFGLCPFHKDTTPSLVVDPTKQLWNCLGACSAGAEKKSGGDILSFIMKYEGCSFPEAVARLKPEATAQSFGSRSIILSRVLEAYQRSYLESRSAQEYIAGRGIDPALARQYRAGYVDGSLLERVSRDSADWKMLAQAGIITGTCAELMRGCVTFPLTAFNQVPVGIYGRSVGKDLHLYLPGPRKGLFNWNVARNYPEIILTESIFDALSFIQCGYLNVLPIYGTNGFIQDHADFLRRFQIKKIILALDSDESGKKAAAALQEKLSATQVATVVLELPSKDPNALLQEKGVDGFKAAIEEQLKEKTSVAVTSQSEGAPSNYEQIGEGELSIGIQERRYRVRGVPKKAYNRLRVALELSVEGRSYLDAIDLFSARSRAGYAAACGAHLDLPKPVIEADLAAILDAIHQYQKKPPEPAKSAEAAMSEGEKKEALRYLSNPKLLEEATEDMETLGYVGEQANKKLGYLASISRFLEDPISIVILSQSGSGKSYLAEVLEKMAAPEHVQMYSRLTPASLYYMGENALSHKFVIIEERSGSAEADYSIRSLQSRKMLTLLAAVKDPATGKIATVKFQIYGPTAFLETTTSSRINYENSTRCFELYLSETREQTERIHQMQRFMKTLEGARLRSAQSRLLSKHHNAQRLLKKIAVVIPYADAIEFPASWLRTRRDHQRFLNLIEVIAFIHQYQRQTKTDRQSGLSYIEATLADYEIAAKLAEEILPGTLSDLKRPVADFKDRIESYLENQAKTRKISKYEIPFTRRQIREETGLPNYRIKDLFTELEELEYLEVEKSNRGGSFRYRLMAGKAGCRVSALLSAGQLRKKLVGK